MAITRTRFDTEFDVRYGLRCARLHVRLLTRIDNLLTFIKVCTAFGGVMAFVSKDPNIAGLVGLLVAIATGVQLVYRLNAKIAQEKVTCENFAKLNRDLPELSDAAAEKALRGYYVTSDPEIEGLRAPAYNDTLLELGLDTNSAYRLDRWQRALHWLAR